MKLLLTAAAAGAAVYALGGYMIFHTACPRGKELDWDDPAAVKKSQYAPYADVIPMAKQWLLEHNAESVYTCSHDGLKLHGKLVRHENARGSMILFHGYRSNFLVEYAAIFEVYYNLGFNLLMVDQRSHRLSEGKYITFGVKESEDCLRWVKWHNENLGDIPLYLCGLSMGASTVQFAAAKPLPNNVRGITADCGFTSPHDILLHVAKGSVGPLAAVLMPMADIWARVLAGFSLHECSTVEALKKCPVPILMIHGTADDFVPSYMSQAGYDACTAEKEIYMVEGAGHAVSFLHDRQRLEEALKRFFLRNLPKEDSR